MAKQNRVYLCMNGDTEQEVFDGLENVPSESLTVNHPVVLEAAKVCAVCVRLGACRADVIRWSNGQVTRQIDISEVPNLIGGQYLTENGTRSFVEVDISAPTSDVTELEYGPQVPHPGVEPEDATPASDDESDIVRAPEVPEVTDSEGDIEPDTNSQDEVPEGFERYMWVVIVDGQPLHLTERDVTLLRYMMANRDRKITRREMIATEVLGQDANVSSYSNGLLGLIGRSRGMVEQVGYKTTGGYILSSDKEIVITDEYMLKRIRTTKVPLGGLVKVEEPSLEDEQSATSGPTLEGPTDDELSLIEIVNDYEPPVVPKPVTPAKPQANKPVAKSKPKSMSGAKKSGSDRVNADGLKTDKHDDVDLIGMYLRDIGRYPLLTKDDEVRLGKEIEQAVEAKAILDTQGDSIDATEKRQLQRAVNRGKRAEQEFTQSNLRLVVSIAKKYQASGLPLLDLIQEGNIGLMHAIEKFDYRKGFKFSTYGTWWIRQAITRGIANTGRMIRLPVHAGDTLSRISKARNQLETRLGRRATLQEIADEVNMEVASLSEILQYGSDAISLNDMVREDGDAELGDLIEDRTMPRPDEVALEGIVEKEVEEMLSGLDPREQEIMKLRYGIGREETMTLEEVGVVFNLTRERIRQIEARAKGKLRHPSMGAKLRGLGDLI